MNERELRTALELALAWADETHPDNLRKLGAVPFVDAARAALSQPAQGAEAGWISVGERLPDAPMQQCAVLWGESFGRPLIGIATLSCPWKGRMLWQGHAGSHNDVTHWMPFPAPPAASIAPATPEGME